MESGRRMKIARKQSWISACLLVNWRCRAPRALHCTSSLFLPPFRDFTGVKNESQRLKLENVEAVRTTTRATLRMRRRLCPSRRVTCQSTLGFCNRILSDGCRALSGAAGRVCCCRQTNRICLQEVRYSMGCIQGGSVRSLPWSEPFQFYSYHLRGKTDHRNFL